MNRRVNPGQTSSDEGANMANQRNNYTTQLRSLRTLPDGKLRKRQLRQRCRCDTAILLGILLFTILIIWLFLVSMLFVHPDELSEEVSKDLLSAFNGFTESNSGIVTKAIYPVSLPSDTNNTSYQNIAKFEHLRSKIDAPTYVIILTQGRMGSSFVGSIFNNDSSQSDQSSFYLFEPFMKKVLDDNNIKVFNLGDILHCNFRVHQQPIKNLLQCSRTSHCQKYSQHHNKKIIPLDATRNECLKSSYRIVKLIRLKDLKTVVRQLIKPSSTNTSTGNAKVRVINLIRNPIDTIHSRIHNKEFSPNDQSDYKGIEEEAKSLCSAIEDQADPEAVAAILKGRKDGHGYIRVRYEDVVKNKVEWAQYLYHFAFGDSDMKLSQEHLSSMKGHEKHRNRVSPYALVKSGREMDLDDKAVDIIESVCKEAMQKLGYL